MYVYIHVYIFLYISSSPSTYIYTYFSLSLVNPFLDTTETPPIVCNPYSTPFESHQQKKCISKGNLTCKAFSL